MRSHYEDIFDLSVYQESPAEQQAKIVSPGANFISRKIMILKDLWASDYTTCRDTDSGSSSDSVPTTSSAVLPYTPAAPVWDVLLG